MGTSATKAKNKYNKENYKQFKANLKPELFNRIDSYCKKNNLSRSQFLTKAIDLLEQKNKGL